MLWRIPTFSSLICAGIIYTGDVSLKQFTVVVPIRINESTRVVKHSCSLIGLVLISQVVICNKLSAAFLPSCASFVQPCRGVLAVELLINNNICSR